ncbi:hypothetical protein TNCV_1295801 [Trichonephila clavipes]|uniref:Uncharacterized protein n=1 Tax=Trichonephila clavipes TaxID=2585209 RepID=A0A8X6SHR2_TRICX|nr:hypothetical protein TNCV_1295801 [Trichonephila clavipes]
MIARTIKLFKQICRLGWTVLELEMPQRRNRQQYEQLSNFQRWRIVDLKEADSWRRCFYGVGFESVQLKNHRVESLVHVKCVKIQSYSDGTVRKFEQEEGIPSSMSSSSFECDSNLRGL